MYAYFYYIYVNTSAVICMVYLEHQTVKCFYLSVIPTCIYCWTPNVSQW